MSNLKIDQEEFNRKAQHILDTVVRPQVERYEKAKAQQKNNMTAVEYIEHMWTLQGAIYKNDIEKALEMEKEQKITLSYFRRVYKDFVDEKITMSRLVELLNEQANKE